MLNEMRLFSVATSPLGREHHSEVPDHVEPQGLPRVESSEEPARRRPPGVEADVAVNILRPVFGLYTKLAKLPREVDPTLCYFPTGNGVPSSP